MNKNIDILENYVNKILGINKTDIYWNYFTSRKNLLNFLLINNNNINDSTIQLINAINYRNNLYKNHYICIPCVINNKSHFIKSLGIGKNNKGIIYLCPGKATDLNTELLCKHLCIELDKLLNDYKCNGKIIWLMDFNYYSLNKAITNINIGINIIKLIKLCYPNIIEKYILIDMPFYYKPVLNLLKKYMDDFMLNNLIYYDFNNINLINKYCYKKQKNKIIEYHN
jgi:hypothetical protein